MSIYLLLILQELKVDDFRYYDEIIDNNVRMGVQATRTARIT